MQLVCRSNASATNIIFIFVFFKDDEDLNEFCESAIEQLQPDSTSCEEKVQASTSKNPQFKFKFVQKVKGNSSSNKRKNESSQKAISWRSPLITSEVINHSSPSISFSESDRENDENLKP